MLNEEGIYVSNPYIHHKTGKPSITAIKQVGNDYQVFDFNLMKILEEMKLIEFNSTFDKFNKVIYTFGAFILTLVSVMLIIYGGFKFAMLIFFTNDINFLDGIFKSIIAITLGLAIFDLSKQIMINEVIFKTLEQDNDRQYNILGKFLVSIIIALSIETLMVVFKITLHDYTKMLSAFYLLIGTTIMFVGLGLFYKFINSVEKK